MKKYIVVLVSTIALIGAATASAASNLLKPGLVISPAFANAYGHSFKSHAPAGTACQFILSHTAYVCAETTGGRVIDSLVVHPTTCVYRAQNYLALGGDQFQAVSTIATINVCTGQSTAARPI